MKWLMGQQFQWGYINFIPSVLVQLNNNQLQDDIQMSEDGTPTTTLSDFQPIEKIGEGSYSTVYKVRRVIDNKLYALKKVKMSVLNEKQKNNALNEIRILASISSPYILEYKDAFFDAKYNLLCIVMEWASSGDVQKLIQQKTDKQTNEKALFAEEQIWKAAVHILSGLALLHEKGILHRDLKTANIFLSQGKYKIGDMNVSKVQSQQQLAYTQTGTPYYASPQIWKDQPYCSKSDIWSFGCLIYQMCAFNPPFHGKDIQSLYKQIKKGKYQKIPEVYSIELQQFIAVCLNKDAKKRPSAQQLLFTNDLIMKKCQEYSIVINQTQSSFKLLSTIKFVKNSEQITSKLPDSKYQKDIYNKISTQETFEKSSSGQLSTRKYYNLNSKKRKPEHKYSKIINIKKVNQKHNTKVNQKSMMPAYKKDEDFSGAKSVSRITSLKTMQNRQKSVNSECDKKGQSFIEKTSFYPKIAKIRNLTTERKQVTQESSRPQLDIIVELDKRCESGRGKLKKVNSVEYKSIIKKEIRIISRKDDSLNVNPLKYMKYLFPETKSNVSLLRHENAVDSHLRKMSKKMIRKYSSNPFLNMKQAECKDQLKKEERNNYYKPEIKRNKYKKGN